MQINYINVGVSSFDAPYNLRDYLDFVLKQFLGRMNIPETRAEIRDKLKDAIVYHYSLGCSLNDSKGNKINNPDNITFNVQSSNSGSGVFADLLHDGQFIGNCSFYNEANT